MEASRFEQIPQPLIDDAFGPRAKREALYVAFPEPRRLDEHIPDEIREMRDYRTPLTGGDVDSYIETISKFADPEGDPPQQACASLISNLSDVMEMKEGVAKANKLFISLRKIDSAVGVAVETAELSALSDPKVAKGYMRDLFVDRPHLEQPILVKELNEFMKFDKTEQRTNGQKVSLTAQIVYLRQSGMTNQGLIDWFNDHQNPFYHPTMTPREIVDHGTDEEIEVLLNFCDGSRGQIAT